MKKLILTLTLLSLPAQMLATDENQFDYGGLSALLIAAAAVGGTSSLITHLTKYRHYNEQRRAIERELMLESLKPEDRFALLRRMHDANRHARRWAAIRNALAILGGGFGLAGGATLTYAKAQDWKRDRKNKETSLSSQARPSRDDLASDNPGYCEHNSSCPHHALLQAAGRTAQGHHIDWLIEALTTHSPSEVNHLIIPFRGTEKILPEAKLYMPQSDEQEQKILAPYKSMLSDLTGKPAMSLYKKAQEHIDQFATTEITVLNNKIKDQTEEIAQFADKHPECLEKSTGISDRNVQHYLILKSNKRESEEKLESWKKLQANLQGYNEELHRFILSRLAGDYTSKHPSFIEYTTIPAIFDAISKINKADRQQAAE